MRTLVQLAASDLLSVQVGGTAATSGDSSHPPGVAAFSFSITRLPVGGGTTQARLINLSTREHVGTGDNVMIAGVVISSGASGRYLIRVLVRLSHSSEFLAFSAIRHSSCARVRP